MEDIMKNLTTLFIKLNFEYIHSTSVEGYSECPTKYLGNLRHSEGVINPSDMPKELFDELKYYSYSSGEFYQPCFSNELTVKELLTRIVEERGGMFDYFTLENGLIKCYHPYNNTVTTLYPWTVSKEAVKHFRRISKYGTFVLGIDRLCTGKVFGGKVYKYL